MGKHPESVGFAIDDTVPMRAVPETLIAHGRYLVSTREIMRLVGDPDGHRTHEGIRRLRAKSAIVSPARGFYVPVPAQYRSWRTVPAEWFIDELMRRMGRAYYVAYLSAAAMHGAAHQAPQAFQVAVDRQLAHRDVGRVKLRFHVNGRLQAHDLAPFIEQQVVHTGTMSVATSPLCAVDITDRPDLAGGLDNVATVLTELAPLEPDALAHLAGLYPRATARRLGWLLETFLDQDATALLPAAAPNDGQPQVLDAHARRSGPRSTRWGLILNTPVEAEA